LAIGAVDGFEADLDHVVDRGPVEWHAGLVDLRATGKGPMAERRLKDSERFSDGAITERGQRRRPRVAMLRGLQDRTHREEPPVRAGSGAQQGCPE